MMRFFTALLLMAGLAAGLLASLAGASAAQSNYKIQPGDTLQVEVLEDSNLNRRVLVLPDGSISFPLAGSVKVAGRTVDTVASRLASRLAGNFAVEPTVTVLVAALAPVGARAASEPDLMDVYILGEINAPGHKQVMPGTRILQFLAESGGLTRFAAKKRIELRRINPKSGQEKVYHFNYRHMGGADSISGATQLAPGDVIVVPERRLFE